MFTIGRVGDVEKDIDGKIVKKTVKPLLFNHPNPYTSRTMVRIKSEDGLSYRYYYFESSIQKIEVLPEEKKSIVTAKFEDVVIEQVLRLVGEKDNENAVEIRYNISYEGEKKDVDIRVILDTQLGVNDNIAINANGEEILNEREYLGGLESFDYQYDPNDSETKVVTTLYRGGNASPYKVQFARYGDAKHNWQYKVDESKLLARESAIICFYNNEKSDSIAITVSAGDLQALPGASTEDVKIEIQPSLIELKENKTSEKGGYLNNPFTIKLIVKNNGFDTYDLNLELDSKFEILGNEEEEKNKLSIGKLGPGSKIEKDYRIRTTEEADKDTQPVTTQNYVRFTGPVSGEESFVVSLSGLERPIYNVKFYSNYGTENGGKGRLLRNERLPKGYKFSTEDPLRAGYIFLGWFDVNVKPSEPATGSTPTLKLGFEPFEISGDIEYYAGWAKSIRLTINLDGKTAEYTDYNGRTVKRYSNFYIDIPEKGVFSDYIKDVTSEKDKFIKWVDEITGTDFDPKGRVVEARSLKADWEAKTPEDMAKVTFKANEGTIIYNGKSSPELTISVDKDKLFDDSTVKAERPGYKFTGWNTFDFSTSPITGDISVEAGWEKVDTVTITFVLNGGSYNGNEMGWTKEIEVGTLLKRPQNPTRGGYSFDNWFELNQTEAFEFDQAVMEDKTIVARWTPNVPIMQMLTNIQPYENLATGNQFPIRSLMSTANDFGQRTTLDPEKIWSVKFNRNISDLDPTRIHILDGDGNELKSGSVSLGDDTVYLKMRAPLEGNTDYHIYIEKDSVLGEGNTSLSQDVIFKFNLEE